MNQQDNNPVPRPGLRSGNAVPETGRNGRKRRLWVLGILTLVALGAAAPLMMSYSEELPARVMAPTQPAAVSGPGARAAAIPGSASFFGKAFDGAGKPLSGVMLSVSDGTGDRKQTVYTARDGSYAIGTTFAGPVTLRARLHRFQDATRKVEDPSHDNRQQDFRLVPFPNAQALSASLTASAHLTEIQWPDEEARKTFVSQCHYCHQIGNALTRTVKPRSLWDKIVARMEGYGAVLTTEQSDTIAQGLQRGFQGQPVDHKQQYSDDVELAQAKIYEWYVGDAMSFVHDADVGHDGKLYGTDQGHDMLWVLDRETGQLDSYPQPDMGLPVGGKLVALQLPLGVFTGQHGPHSLAQGKDGRFWITNALSSTLTSFDPKTKQYKTYGFEESVLYPHTVRIDGQGVVWFTAAVSNKIVRFDPATERARVIQLPHNGIGRFFGDVFTPLVLEYFGEHNPRENRPVTDSPHKWTGGREFANLPYGIDVHPKDGAIWYAKLYANRLGRIDPKTLEIEEFDTPLQGPRRPRFDHDGILWIPSFDESALMRFDPESRTFETYSMPTLAPNEYEAPYALNVHPKTGDIWITSNMSDRILRFDPKTKKFLAYPCPTRVTFLRDMVFTEDGQVCSSSSNLPAYGIEGGRDSFICIDPQGGSRDRTIQERAAQKDAALGHGSADAPPGEAEPGTGHEIP